MLRRQITAAWRPCGSNLSPWEQMELRPFHKGSKGKWEQHKGRCREGKKGRINQQLVLPTPGGINQGEPASSLELDLHLVKAEVQEDQAHKVIAREAIQISRTALHG